jgi:solute carrier family 50 protein (sugar transporter)
VTLMDDITVKDQSRFRLRSNFITAVTIKTLPIAIMRFHASIAAIMVLPSASTALQARPYQSLSDQHPSRTRKNSPSFPWLTTTAKLRGGALSLSPDAVRFAQTLAPTVGIFTSSALYFAPASAVLAAIRSNDLGDLNPVPLAIMSIVTVAWLAYGVSVQDAYVALSSIAGCIGSIGYVLAILPLLQHDKPRLRMTQGILLAGSAATICLWTFLGLSGASTAKIGSVLGMFASVLFIVLSGSPLSTIKSVIATKSSGSILGFYTVAQVVDSLLWTVYGLAIKDSFLWGPSIVVRIGYSNDFRYIQWNFL